MDFERWARESYGVGVIFALVPCRCLYHGQTCIEAGESLKNALVWLNYAVELFAARVDVNALLSIVYPAARGELVEI